MLKPLRKSAAEIEALDRIAAWTRARFRLAAEDAVLVTEIACRQPGCPPLETAIAFWTAPDRRHHYKVFKPAVAVVEDDLPPAWYRDQLIDDGTCECC